MKVEYYKKIVENIQDEYTGLLRDAVYKEMVSEKELSCLYGIKASLYGKMLDFIDQELKRWEKE